MEYSPQKKQKHTKLPVWLTKVVRIITCTTESINTVIFRRHISTNLFLVKMEISMECVIFHSESSTKYDSNTIITGFFFVCFIGLFDFQ